MSSLPAPFTAAHRSYVKSLYKRILTNELNWIVRRDLWKAKALAIRAEFERNRDIHDPRALASILEKAEADLAARKHPDPCRVPTSPDGTKWERNIPPPIRPYYPYKEGESAH